MRKSRPDPARVLIPLLAAIVLVMVAGWSFGLIGRGDPLDGVPCGGCHLTRAPEIRPENAHLLVAAQERLCTDCHPGALEASHPSGIRPSMSVPARFPLDWRQAVTCSTCHSIHAPAHGALRVSERGAAFCTGCHEMEFFTRMADQGGSVLLSGHLRVGDHLEQSGVDEYSVQCMACHEEQGEGPMVSLSDGLARHGSGRAEHPVGVDYARAAAMGGSYRPPERLSPAIRLPGGQVSCISCHEGYSGLHGKLVVSNEGSNLCFQCHDL